MNTQRRLHAPPEGTANARAALSAHDRDSDYADPHTSEESLRIMSRRRGWRARRKGDGQGAGDNAALRFLKEQATPCYTTDPPTLAGVTREKGASTRRHARVGPGR